MLILAGVIIISAVADGGIIDRAQIAMRENEKEEIEDLIVSSYVYKTSAATTSSVVLDLDKTGIAIYENLRLNGFTVKGEEAKDKSGNYIKDENGKDVMTAPLKEQNGKKIIDIYVKGKYVEYIGIVTEKGLEKKDDNEKSDLEKLKLYFENNDIFTKIEYPETKEEIMTGDISQIKFKNDDTVTDAENIQLLNLLQNAGTFVVTMQYNNNKYIGYVRASDSICTLIKKAEKSESELEIYLFGENNEGKFLLGESAIYDITNNVFLPDITHPEIDIYKEIKVSHVDITSKKITIRYDGYIYTLSLEDVYDESGNIINYKTNKDLGFSKYKLEDNLGKYVEYKGNKWIVLSDADDGIELISANTLEKVLLGDATNGELARESYNDAINILTRKCIEITGITVGGDVLEIRNVGGPAEDTTTMQETLTLNWEKHNGSENGFKRDDENYKADYEKMKEIGIANSDNNMPYWLSSREFPYHNGLHGLFFSIRVCNLGVVNEDVFSALLYIRNSGDIVGETSEFGIRPVIKIKKQLFESKITTGEGSENNPIKLD